MKVFGGVIWGKNGSRDGSDAAATSAPFQDMLALQSR